MSSGQYLPSIMAGLKILGCTSKCVEAIEQANRTVTIWDILGCFEGCAAKNIKGVKSLKKVKVDLDDSPKGKGK